MFVVAFDKKYVSSFDNLDSQISQNIQYLPVLAILFRSAVSYKTKALCTCVNDCECVKNIIWISFFFVWNSTTI